MSNDENSPTPALDLHTEMPLPKLNTTPEQRALFEKHFGGEDPGVGAARIHANLEFLELPKTPLQITRDLVQIAYEDFAKVSLRVGTVVSAERVPKKDKLLKLMVDFDEGNHRQIIAGIGKTFAPETLVGHQYVFVANLAPREVLKGLVSNGMILATGDAEHLVLIRPETGAPNGSRFQ